jgi:predicted DNA-binding protein (UPF0251 family)
MIMAKQSVKRTVPSDVKIKQKKTPRVYFDRFEDASMRLAALIDMLQMSAWGDCEVSKNTLGWATVEIQEKLAELNTAAQGMFELSHQAKETA